MKLMSIKLAIIYYSSTGTNHQLAQWAADAAKATGAEVKVLKVPELAPEAAIESNPAWKAHMEATADINTVSLDDLEWADAIIFSVPTRFGNLPAQMKQFLDTTGGLWFHGKLTNKVVSAMSSASNAHGGQEQTILSLYTTMYHWGAIVVAPGYSDPSIFAAGGNPYGTSVTVNQEGKMIEDVRGAVEHQAKRVVTVAEWVKKGMK
ncbi:NAD(P)H:quinone oxidoreductase [Ammoniphilus sp. CFH 90114]|uniref:NAD(P)H:quinone oxidoreductase n=1 Tax=Ammoniphilus sp. CFH 90114 TaxID=2493665 RepID=UPI00100FC7D4|nr:NAD(P)H:quinone oxidoreductase [Ammoniphilus sp. CFH 90114]RXT13725.1 NAD(P)H:quinone oxidoreductase [Ammoniphilus sp. CFH 90114]